MTRHSIQAPKYRVVFQCDKCDASYERHNPGQCIVCNAADLTRYHIPTDQEFASWSDEHRARYCSRSTLPASRATARATP